MEYMHPNFLMGYDDKRLGEGRKWMKGRGKKYNIFSHIFVIPCESMFQFLKNKQNQIKVRVETKHHINGLIFPPYSN